MLEILFLCEWNPLLTGILACVSKLTFMIFFTVFHADCNLSELTVMPFVASEFVPSAEE